MNDEFYSNGDNFSSVFRKKSTRLGGVLPTEGGSGYRALATEPAFTLFEFRPSLSLFSYTPLTADRTANCGSVTVFRVFHDDRSRSDLERAARADERAHSHRSKNPDDDEDKRVREVRPLVSFLVKPSPGCVRYDFG